MTVYVLFWTNWNYPNNEEFYGVYKTKEAAQYVIEQEVDMAKDDRFRIQEEELGEYYE